MIYNYGPIGNPNNAYVEGFVYHHVGAAVTADVFAGTGRSHEEIVGRIRKELKPQSFATGKTMTISNKSEHHPDGAGVNLIGKITGTDPALKDEVIIIGGHLDHLGRLWKLLPGANDNATAVAVTLGVAEAMAKCAVKPKRTIVFFFFGSEEQSEDQGTQGSHYYTEHPVYPLDKTDVFINMEGPGERRQDRRVGRHDLSQVLGVRRESEQELRPQGADDGPGLLSRAPAARLGLVFLEGRAVLDLRIL